MALEAGQINQDAVDNWCSFHLVYVVVIGSLGAACPVMSSPFFSCRSDLPREFFSEFDGMCMYAALINAFLVSALGK